jgi:hypothetical protein
VVRPLARPPALNPSPARRQNASERDGAGHDGGARARLPAAAGELRGLRGDSCIHVYHRYMCNAIAVNLSGSILDARLQTIHRSFNSLSSPGWVATARWTSGAGAMGSKPECFQFLESEEMKNRLEQHMKDALKPYSGGKFWLGRPPRRP